MATTDLGSPIAATLRPGALALGASGVLFALFPLVRPFFRLNVFDPGLAATASPAIASSAWILAHLLLLAAFVLLPLGLAALAARPDTPSARRAAAASANAPAARTARPSTITTVIGPR